jgi:hypothetical protein
MDRKTLSKAKTLEIQIDECQRTYEKLKGICPIRYITFESMKEGIPTPYQISGHKKPSLVNALIPRILEEIKELEAIYEEELSRL